MAFNPASGLLLLFELGDGESPEQFDALCSMTAKTVGHQGTENTFEIPPCPTADDIAWLVSEIQNKRIVIQFSGLLNTADYDVFYSWWDSGESRNGLVTVDVPAADGGRILTAAWKLPTFDLTGNRGEKMTVSGTIASDGVVTKTNNS
jgi:hypothetical protein